MKRRPYSTALQVALAILFVAGVLVSLLWDRAYRTRQPPSTFATILFLITFLGGFLAVLTTHAHNNGWTALAERYRALDSPEGRSLSYQVVRFGDINEGGVTRVRVVDRGLFLHVVFLFRFMHPPLLIPWRDIGWVRERKELWFRVWELDLGGITTVRIKKKAYEQLKDWVPAPVPGPPPIPVGVPPPPIE